MLPFAAILALSFLTLPDLAQAELLTPLTPSIALANNETALELYRRLAAGKSENFFFSPYSIHSVLTMASAAAAGETARQMSQALHLAQAGEDPHRKAGELLRSLNESGSSGRFVLSAANRLWGRMGAGFKRSFLEFANRHYGAGFKETDFATNSERARAEINAWVKAATREKIPEILPPGSVGPATGLVMVNAVYFKGDWAAPFKKSATAVADFHRSGGSRASVPMMRQTKAFGYHETAALQALEMPYVGDRLSMIVILPKKNDGLRELEGSLRADFLSAIFRGLRVKRVETILPKFKTGSNFNLAPTLKKMGMKAAFDPKEADFSGMNGRKDLVLSAALHSAIIEVNEEGTEAAAATGLLAVRTGGPKIEPIPLFKADHPFLFLIRDRRSEAILFLGKIENPKD